MYQSTILEFLNMGGGEMMLIGIAVLLLFGGKKLPELARGLGKGIREFKDASEGVKREIHRNINSVDVDESDKTEDQKIVDELNNERHHPTEQETSAKPTSLTEEKLVKEVEEVKIENKSNEIHS